MSKLKEFLSAVIGERASQRRDVQVMRSIHKSEQFQVRAHICHGSL